MNHTKYCAMFLCKLTILCLSTTLIYGLDPDRKTKSKFEKCPIEVYQSKFDVLPGKGWDNLANLEMARILDLNFSKCQFSDDNRYLIPNQLSLTPLKVSHVELFSETITHFMNYTSMTSKSVNVDANAGFSHFKIGGGFSYENTQIKSDQLETKSIFTRVQLRYNVFQSLFEPDAPLFPTFKNRIMDIAGLVVENKDSLYPKYLADMLIHDYGTHIIHTVKAGAILSKTDAIDSTYSKKYQSDTTTITASASASFLSFFSISTRFQSKSSNEQVIEYNKNCVKTHIETVGGSIFGSNFSLAKWENSVMNNLVPIDRRGDPIYFILNRRTLPELDDETIYKVSNLVKEAILRYYTRNAREGCLNIFSPNFNSDANIDKGNCKSPEVNFTMGGVYQTCVGSYDQCDGHASVNPLTGGYSCPVGFISIQLHSGLNQCREYCSGFWFWRRCHTTCSYFYTFWCVPKIDGPNHNGYQFGGLISKSMPECPFNFIAVRLGNYVQICVSSNADPLNEFAIKFGGFFSCNVGNPLAQYDIKKKTFLEVTSMKSLKAWPKRCADGYVAHIATIDRGCQISYCTETNKVTLGPLPNLHRPPFIQLNYNPNSTKVMIFSNKNGETFIKDNLGSWKLDDIKKQNRSVLIGSIVGCVLISACVIWAITVIQRRQFKRKLRSMDTHAFSNEVATSGYGALNNADHV